MEPSQNVYDKQNTLLALNMAVVAVRTIVSSEDRIVLEQQYRTIIDRLKFGSIESDPEIVRLHGELLKANASVQLLEAERERFYRVYNREQRKTVFDALKGPLTALPLSGVFSWLVLGKALLEGANAFFGYRELKERLHDELDDELWHLEREKRRVFVELQRTLLTAMWPLLRKYGLSDELRVKQEDLDSFEKALEQPDPVQARSMFEVLEKRLAAYPPFWFYYGEAALRSNDANKAEECFAQFDRADRDVLDKDAYKMQIAKYRIAMNRNASLDYIKRQLAIIDEHGSQWLDWLFYGVVSFAIGEKEQGKNAVRRNINFRLENKISSLVLKGMEQGEQYLWAALARAYYEGKGVVMDKKAAYKYALLARRYGDNSVNDLIEQIEGNKRVLWIFSFKTKPEIAKKYINAAKAEVQMAYRREINRDSSYLAQLKGQKELLVPSPAEYTTITITDKRREYKEVKESDVKLSGENFSMTSVKIGSVVAFGRYQQRIQGEKTPIQWIVLEKQSDKLLLMAQRELDWKQYHHEEVAITWAECDLRKWLNNDFLTLAFTKEEKELLQICHNQNPASAEFLTTGGAPTADYVYLLSVNEIQRFFKTSIERVCQPTWYAVDQGAKVFNGNSAWYWLRSPGKYSYRGTVVTSSGSVMDAGRRVTCAGGIRPVLCVTCNKGHALIRHVEPKMTVNTEPNIMTKVVPFTQTTKQRSVIETFINQVDKSERHIVEEPQIALNTVVFGKYPQDATSVAKPIEWYVLSEKNGMRLLLSKLGLATQSYHLSHSRVTWENCDLRQWLVYDFLQSAFTKAEQEKIVLVSNQNDNNIEYRAGRGGKSTNDKIFLLSPQQVESLMRNTRMRRCLLSERLRKRGVCTEVDGCGWWWVRSPGYRNGSAAYVNYDGVINYYGYRVNTKGGCVRPALWVSSL